MVGWDDKCGNMETWFVRNDRTVATVVSKATVRGPDGTVPPERLLGLLGIDGDLSAGPRRHPSLGRRRVDRHLTGSPPARNASLPHRHFEVSWIAEVRKPHPQAGRCVVPASARVPGNPRFGPPSAARVGFMTCDTPTWRSSSNKEPSRR